MTVDNQTWAAVCFRAADLIEFVGHARGDAYTKNDAGEHTGFCTLGALSQACLEIIPDTIWWYPAPIRPALERHIRHTDVVLWSDSSPTDVVVDTLRRAGKDLANEEVES